MKLFIDADGSPVVKNAVQIAKSYNIDVVIVKNHAHQIQSDYAQVVDVDVLNDSADFYILNNLKKKDIVVTQDYGLAALALAKQGQPINENGFIFTEANIDQLLDQRYAHKILRNQGHRHKGQNKRKVSQDKMFESKLKSLIEKSATY